MDRVTLEKNPSRTDKQLNLRGSLFFCDRNSQAEDTKERKADSRREGHSITIQSLCYRRYSKMTIAANL